MQNTDIFGPYDRLIEIDIEGRTYRVPENNSILRCLQFIDIDSISFADLCWNGDCLECRVWLDDNGKERSVISCRTNARDGMKIVRLGEGIPFEPKR
ncbi:MAG: 2Fe-2S iron-sulfur cluster-binding protein [Pyrinomonadaceae bacterium]